MSLTAADHTPRFPDDPKPRADAPNVVVVVLDDVGFGQFGCFGSDIATLAIDGLAGNGLRYNRFHVTALCSPTRACLLTGRNHHAVGMGFLADIPLGFPGYTCRIPPSAAALPRVLRDAGYSTIAVGKWHLVPRWERSAAGPFDRWPLGLGFERFYGFLQGDTNQWTPNLVCDNHYVEPPARPEDGYHLSEDLASTAIRYLLDQQHSAPGKPFFLYLGFGAGHAPHHVPASWVSPYRGRFDDGWDQWRRRVFERQVALGVVPADAVCTERPAWVQPWSSLGADERRMHARMQEVFAGFLTHADAQIGRLVEFLEVTGQLDNTLLVVLSDNGASAEGGRSGTFNEHRFTSRAGEGVVVPPEIEEWGGFRSYNHYSWGWAWAGNAPFRLWKRYAWLGGTRVPLVVHWPAGMAARGAVRSQFAHAVDLMPTILDVCGLPVPAVVDGVPQQPVDGASLAGTFGDPAAGGRTLQYFEMLGSRSIVDGTWKATTDHVSTGVADEERFMEGSRSFATDRWELFDLSVDFSEAHDVADAHPDVVRRLEQRWLAEAERNQVLPVDDGLVNRFAAFVAPAWPPGAVSTFLPGGGPVPDESVPMLVGAFRITAAVQVPESGASGVLCALGDWNGGYALYVLDDGRPAFTFARAGDVIRVVGSEPLVAGAHQVAVEMTPSEAGGVLSLTCDAAPLGSAAFDGMLPFALQHGGTGLCLGYDRGFPVCDDYRPPARWGGVLHRVTVETGSGRPVSDVEAALRAD